MIKVLLERSVKREKYRELLELIKELRSAALHQPGYMTGETLVSENGIVKVLVISSWVSEEHWKAWLTSEQRIQLETIADALLEDEVKVSVYGIPDDEDE
jgi:antibiotic biosynthesis monooxygenase (ABM) superfamily enzyme